jgi:hypothetical protein
MTRPDPRKIAYVGQAALHEELWPEPSADALARQLLEAENRELRDELTHLRSALATAGRVLEPYCRRLNGRDHE